MPRTVASFTVGTCRAGSRNIFGSSPKPALAPAGRGSAARVIDAMTLPGIGESEKRRAYRASITLGTNSTARIRTS
ncbi:hypothetical protein GCM10007147_12050 [Nocardiopsis kunsanensis]|uniref:Uncharacterized protein n=1 Tax=Nocardiopsis kunsanensis TaxID=141693 RepID=A0A919CGM2_9ACTN|nr:hypothetical protein GCM10007147_12050 [Nocardiopsis kunsanensis]